ncbi:MAG: isopentenyl-diphosphate Delta-isomerase [Bacteroidota bacterium]
MILEEEQLILVDENDHELGFMPKLEVHQKGLLHRAFSILIFNSKGEFLIQKRADGKYHSSNLWTNTCCSHPRKGEIIIDAAHRRLKEEMGFDCELNFAYKFIYKTDFENELVEHEFDHVFLGEFNENPLPNPSEVSDFKWIRLSDLRNDMQKSPEKYTFWFKKILQEHLKSFYFPKK